MNDKDMDMFCNYNKLFENPNVKEFLDDYYKRRITFKRTMKVLISQIEQNKIKIVEK